MLVRNYMTKHPIMIEPHKQIFEAQRIMVENKDSECGQEEPEQRRDSLLLRLLKTPPQPRPKRERDKSVQPKRKKPKKKTPDK